MNDWDKILDDFARKCKGGAPDMTNPRHLALLRESLIKFGWKENATNAFLGNLREGKPKTNPWQTGSGKWRGERPDGSRQSYDDIEKTKRWISGVDTDDEDEAKPTQEQIEYANLQKETSDLRDKGTAGAGGQTASQGESRYCDAVDNLDEDDYYKGPKDNPGQNKKEIDETVKGLDERKPKYPSAQEVRDLESMGLTPDSKEGKRYIAQREHWAEQELERIKKLPKPNVYSNSDGFGGNEEPRPEEPKREDFKDDKDFEKAQKKWQTKADKWDKKEADADVAYKDWMKAAYDGALSTQELLDDSRMDTSKPTQTVQSTTVVDNKVQSDLQAKADEACSINEGSGDCIHYTKQVDNFKHNRKYHDTYVVGVDSEGRTFIVSVSNKKNSEIKDPQNNTTPSQRFDVIKDDYDESVVGDVIDALDESIKIVDSVARTTTSDASKADVDDDFIDVLELAGPGYVTKMQDRGGKRKRSKTKTITVKDKKGNEVEKAKPAIGSEFGCWLEDQGITEKQWNDDPPPDGKGLTLKEKVKYSQKFMGDTDYHKALGPQKIPKSDPPEYEDYTPPYDFAKMFIKVGEVHEGGHRKLKSIRAKLEKDGKSSALQSKSVAGAGKIKEKESNSVTRAHRNVVDRLTEADDRDGFPEKNKKGEVVKNGERTKAYISTVMNALHCYRYIDMEDEDDDTMILQMGIRGVKPSHIRNCLADQTEYTWGDRKGLKDHIENTSSINAETGAISIVTKKEAPEDHPDYPGFIKVKIADDTWRTAGTSQKVASGFGEDMRDCIKEAADKDRQK